MLTISPAAVIGGRSVQVNGLTSITQPNAFSVLGPSLTLISISPVSGPPTVAVSITATGFVENDTPTFTATLTPNAGGSPVAVPTTVQGTSSNRAVNFSIPPGTLPGVYTVTLAGSGYGSTNSLTFTVTGAASFSLNPASGTAGTTLQVTISGASTTFPVGSTIANFGPGISVGGGPEGGFGPVIVQPNGTAIATLAINAGATLGPRAVQVNGIDLISQANAFTVTAAPVIVSVNPATGQLGQTFALTITGLNTQFTSQSTVSLGSGIAVNSVTVGSATSLVVNITVDSEASVGGRTVVVTTGSQVVTLPDGFFVLSTAQNQPLSCTSNAGVPPLLRAEGFTELTGDLLIVCTGGAPGQTNNINLQLFLNVPITSRLVGGQSEALLIVDEAGIGLPPGLTTPAIYRAIAAQGENSIVWPDVAFTSPGAGNQRVLRITNVRANATSLAASASVVPSQVFAFLSVSPSQSLPLGRAQHTVGFVLPGLAFDVTNCVGTSAVSNAFAQCVGENSSGNRNLISGTTGNMQFGVRFTEGFQTAFKPQLVAGQMQSTPGVVYHSESGFLRTTDLPFAVGGADTGTRLVARFNNIPNGVRLWVTTRPSFGSTVGLDAVLVQTGANAAGGTSQVGVPLGIAGTATLLCGLTAADGVAAAEIPVTNNSAMAVWEITSANMALLDSAVFGVAVSYTPDTPNQRPGLGLATVSGSFGPFYPAASDAGRMSSTLPIPRFLDTPTISNVFRIDSCVTNLLFPFVTNQAGFDTGIAVSNTSTDPFGTPQRQQSGACTVNYYGSSPGGAAPPAQRTASPVASGSTMAFVISSGGSHGLTPTPGFQGYLIVQCDFRYAHGFAFVTDGPIGTARVAEGYLGLVMDAPIPTRGSVSETLNH
jgi:hypothetical protein